MTFWTILLLKKYSESRWEKTCWKEKITLPLIYTLAELGPDEKTKFAAFFKNRKADQDAYQTLLDWVRRGEVLEKIREEAQGYVDDAAMCLKCFPDSSVKANLLTLIQYIIDRTY